METVRVSLHGSNCQEVGYVVKCLGVAIDDGLTWKEHITLVRKKCLGQWQSYRG